MAKEKEREEKEPKREEGKRKEETKGKRESGRKEGGKKKLHLHQIITTQAHDGTWSHEHVYKDKKEDMHARPPVFAGTSQDMDDLHQHVDDHWGPQAGGEANEEHAEPDQDDGVDREHDGEPAEPGEE